jgi:hypothetical protein
MFLGSKAWSVRRADNLSAICEPIVYTMWDPQHLKPHESPWPVMGIALLFTFALYVLLSYLWYSGGFPYFTNSVSSK